MGVMSLLVVHGVVVHGVVVHGVGLAMVAVVVVLAVGCVGHVMAGRLGQAIDHVLIWAYRRGLTEYVLVRAEKL